MTLNCIETRANGLFLAYIQIGDASTATLMWHVDITRMVLLDCEIALCTPLALLFEQCSM